MVLKADQQRVKALLSETITLLCKNGLNFRKEFSIEGLIGITLDQEEIFLVSIKETIRTALAEAAAASDSGGNKSVSGVNVNNAGARRRRERDVEVKKPSSPPPFVMTVETDGDQLQRVQPQVPAGDETSWSKVSTSLAASTSGMTDGISMTATPKQERTGGDDDTQDVEDSSTQLNTDLNLTFSNIPLSSNTRTTDDGGFDGSRANKRRRLQSHQAGSGSLAGSAVRASAAIGSAASNDASSGSGFETFQPHSTNELDSNVHNRGGGDRAKLEHSDIIEIKDELMSGGEGEEEEGAEGDESYADYGGEYEGMYETGDQGEGEMNMYTGADGGIMNMGSGSVVPRRRSAPHGNGGASSRQDPSVHNRSALDKCLSTVNDYTPNIPEILIENFSTAFQVPKRMNVCPRCDLVCKSADILRRHEVHVHQRQFPYHCSLCGKGVATRVNLIGHMATRHNVKKHFECEFCNRAFGYKRSLEDHINNIHMG